MKLRTQIRQCGLDSYIACHKYFYEPHDILLSLSLTIVCALTVGAYVYKKEFDTPPPPKPDIRYYHINF